MGYTPQVQLESPPYWKAAQNRQFAHRIAGELDARTTATVNKVSNLSNTIHTAQLFSADSPIPSCE